MTARVECHPVTRSGGRRGDAAARAWIRGAVVTPAQVLDVIARLEVAYRTELTDPERRLWIEQLEPFEGELVAAAAEDRITSSSPFMPKVGEIMDAVREARAIAPTRERPALSAAEGISMPHDIREKWMPMLNKVTRAKEIEAGYAEEDAEWQRRKGAALAGVRMAGACAGTGKMPVEMEDGKRLCPDCGTEILDIIAEPLPKPKRRRSWKTGLDW